MSYIYTAFGDKIVIENFSNKSDVKKEKDIVKKEKDIVKKEIDIVKKEIDIVKKEIEPVYDFNLYSHFRLYSNKMETYLTLYPRYLNEHETQNGFALATSRDTLEKVLKNSSGDLKTNLVNLREKEGDINKDVLVFTKIGSKIVKVGDIKSKIYYDFENTSLTLLTDEKNNKLIAFDFSKSGTSIYIYDHKSSDIFYKINKNRDTFYLSRTPDKKKLIRIGSCDIENNIDTTDYKGPTPTEFSFKPIILKNDIKIIPKIEISDNLKEELKKITGNDKANINQLTKIRIAEFEKKKETLNPLEMKILVGKNKLPSELLTELHLIVSTYMSIKKSFKYYLVEVKTEGEHRKSSKLNYIDDNIRGGFDFIILNKDSDKKGKKHLKVWVKDD